jgi:uncharacterized membrane protein YgdD (TMEM256/DUF423 family)
MNKSIIAISGLIAVAFGAFGAHGLKSLVDEKTVHAFQTGVAYQFYHTFALALCLWLAAANRWTRFAYGFFLTGMILFSGSLYLIAFGRATAINLDWMGPITPVGGLCLMMGWIFLLKSFLDSKV